MKKPTSQTFNALQKIVLSAKFPQNTQKIQITLDATFKQISENLEHPYFLHKGKRPIKINFGTSLPNGQRDESMLRNYLIAELFRSWFLAHEEVPVINNKGYPASPFVIFSEQIFYLLGIGKIEDHLEEFESFRAKSLKTSGIE
uniref:hypothetical protein n=1 Tax=Polynucleobacter sp. TaxID=2029855 RepID=UPI00404855A8